MMSTRGARGPAPLLQRHPHGAADRLRRSAAPSALPAATGRCGAQQVELRGFDGGCRGAQAPVDGRVLRVEGSAALGRSRGAPGRSAARTRHCPPKILRARRRRATIRARHPARAGCSRGRCHGARRRARERPADLAADTTNRVRGSGPARRNRTASVSAGTPPTENGKSVAKAEAFKKATSAA